MKDKLHELYEREMSRSDFLKFILLVAMSVFGITHIISSLSQMNGTSAGGAHQGYGASVYGGESNIAKG